MYGVSLAVIASPAPVVISGMLFYLVEMGSSLGCHPFEKNEVV
jgi:hypothetical protein